MPFRSYSVSIQAQVCVEKRFPKTLHEHNSSLVVIPNRIARRTFVACAKFWSLHELDATFSHSITVQLWCSGVHLSSVFSSTSETVFKRKSDKQCVVRWHPVHFGGDLLGWGPVCVLAVFFTILPWHTDLQVLCNYGMFLTFTLVPSCGYEQNCRFKILHETCQTVQKVGQNEKERKTERKAEMMIKW